MCARGAGTGLTRAEAWNIGLRVFVGQRSANVSASDTVSDRTIGGNGRSGGFNGKRSARRPLWSACRPRPAGDGLGIIEALELYDPAPEPSPEALSKMEPPREAAGLAVKASASPICRCGIWAQQGIHGRQQRVRGGYRPHRLRAVLCLRSPERARGWRRDYDGDSRIFQTGSAQSEDSDQGRRTRSDNAWRTQARLQGPIRFVLDERISSAVSAPCCRPSAVSAIARGASWLARTHGRTGLCPTGLSLIEELLSPPRRRLAPLLTGKAPTSAGRSNR